LPDRINTNRDRSTFSRLQRSVFGAPKDVRDPSLFHKLSLIPLLAWIGLGADGLSSSAYGPPEAYLTLGSHTYLALLLGLATALTVFIISYAYSRIIEHFPYGGGGYIVATHMLGKEAGVISGSALLVDYVLTITVSVVSCVDALFSFLPLHYQEWKIETSCALIVLLMVLNIRGVKESIKVLAPIFILFIATHILLLAYGIGSHVGQISVVAGQFHAGWTRDLGILGWVGIAALCLKAYSMGAGTYTGIEAVSNGLQIMREPHVQTGKRTMVYMATSLAVTAGGLFLCYLLVNVSPVEGRTLNAVLAGALYGHWPMGSLLAFLTLFAEGALLLVAAQTGFIDGPRVMANMAVDHWFPRRFADLSGRLTMRNGVVLMGISSIALIVMTGASISRLIVMYSINVFLTFSLSEFGMSKFFIQHRKTEPKWKQHLPVHLTGFTLCATILAVTVSEKFREGGWVTLVITAAVIGLCGIIRGHYLRVGANIRQLDDQLANLPADGEPTAAPADPADMTAIQLVGAYNGFGVHTFLSIQQKFRGLYKNMIFVSVAVLDSGSFKGAAEVEKLQSSVQASLDRYVDLSRRLGIPAEGRMMMATNVVDTAVEMCLDLSKEFPRSTVFTGQLTFRLEKAYHRLLHNETAFAIQRRLIWEGVNVVILPIRLDM